METDDLGGLRTGRRGSVSQRNAASASARAARQSRGAFHFDPVATRGELRSGAASGRASASTRGSHRALRRLAAHTSWGRELLLVAHALPDGSFSTDDAVAVAWAREQCPSVPDINALGDDGEGLQNVHCARLWGVSTADLRAEIMRTVQATLEDETNPRPNARFAHDDMLLWAAYDPPFSLAAR